MRYVLWLIGILGFGYWGVMAIVRPEALYSNFRERAARVGGMPRFIEWWLSSRYFRVEMRVGGAISLLIAIALLWSLALNLLGRLPLSPRLGG